MSPIEKARGITAIRSATKMLQHLGHRELLAWAKQNDIRDIDFLTQQLLIIGIDLNLRVLCDL